MKITKKQLEYFIIFNQKQIKQIINEESSINAIGNRNITDDGPAFNYSSMEHYKSVSKKQAEKIGFEVVNLIMPEMKFEDYGMTYYNETMPGSSFFVKQSAMFSSKDGIEEKTEAVEMKNQESYKRWKKHIDGLVADLGWSYVTTKDEKETAKDLTSEFMNEVFDIAGNSKIYVTTKGDMIKIARSTNELKTPKNPISIISEQTNDVFISNLITINEKLNRLKHPNIYLLNGKNFLLFENINDKITLSNVITSENKTIQDTKTIKRLQKYFNTK